MALRRDERLERAQGAYSTPIKTVRYMVRQLASHLPRTDGLVIDPATGDGVFLRELAELVPGQRSVGFELHDDGDRDEAVEVVHRDFIEYFAEGAKDLGLVQGIIGNPPYNCHESPYIRANKKALRQVFAEIGVLNTYSMFLYASLRMLAEGGILCMLVMDSFLTNRYHRRLRELILSNAEIIEILLAPRRLFHSQKADVRTAIITLRKTSSPDPKHQMRLVDRVGCEDDYQCPKHEQLLCQSEYSELSGSNLVVCVPDSIRLLFREPYRSIGDMVPGGAGISTGNDREYLMKGERPQGWIPFVKNPGGSRFFYQTDTYITPDWESLAEQRKNFMLRNRRFFFKAGVSCSSMGIPFGAVLLPEGCLFGVNANLFPRSERERLFLLGLLNSSLCTYLVRAVLNRTNMATPGYVKQIPYRYEASDPRCQQVAAKARAACEAAQKEQLSPVAALSREIDEIVLGLYGIPKKDRSTVSQFVMNLYEAV